ncbi:MAG: IniB N-terminal domain-containing protein [Kutzneria sp.]|nr:IniB N-terminal domain-containing protein [Kutzneria sp.]MBV9846548.1 IniB N-terminal domain-containing protein [Kutzneria sp.]
MPTELSLLGFILGLVADPVARQRFDADPEHVLRAHGFDELSAHDIVDALPLVTDTVRASYEHSVTGGTEAHGPAASPPSAQPEPGETHLAAAIRHISYITATYGGDTVHPAVADVNIWADEDAQHQFDTVSGHAAAPVTGFGSGASEHIDADTFGAGHLAVPDDTGGSALITAHATGIPYGATDPPSDVHHDADPDPHGGAEADHPMDHPNPDWFDGPHS